MAVLKGIDVSIHQDKIDWTKVKDNVDFAILRAGYGDAVAYPWQKDSTFETNYKGCKDNGISCGVYWYSYAMSTEAAKREAQACINILKSKKFEYPIFFDLEEHKQFANGKAFCDSLVKTFCTELEKAGYFAGLYMSRYPLQAYISPSVADKYALWVAEYGGKCNYCGSYGIWQYSDKGRVNGISANVDVNYCYVDYPDKIKNAGLNGYTKPVPAAKILDTTGLKKGDKGVGVFAYKQLLKIAGKKLNIAVSVDNSGGFGGGTEKATNAILKKLGYKANGIAGSKLISKLYNIISK